ncbi:energy transducer TonB [Sphingomonas qilianensis]|uniref:Energy transducer TonB n=1 Tax=Sphingomonas qilianensis TaxID=1736690 RepID=A0ABU9XWN6_9SPHN
MSRCFLNCAALALTLSATQAVASSAHQVDTLDEWVQHANKELKRSMVPPRDGSGGKSTVTFRRGADGRPTDIVVLTRGGHIASAARRSVSRMRNLPPLPSGFTPDQRITMHLLVGDATNQYDFERENAKMVASAKAANAKLAARVSNVAVASIGSRR